jgi:sRNA-binding regulator protein Hfq
MLIEEYDKYVASLEHECLKVSPGTLIYKQATSFDEFTMILSRDTIVISRGTETIAIFKYR